MPVDSSKREAGGLVAEEREILLHRII